MHKGYLALALLCGSTGLEAATTPTIVPAKTVTFKDWIVGCDNGLACQAVALMPDNLPDDTLSLVLRRGDGNTDEPGIEISGFAANTTAYRILVDGRVASSGAIAAGKDQILIAGNDAKRLSRALAKGRILRLTDGSGLALGRVSLSGSSAALRYLDAAQGRIGSRSAIVATGRRVTTAKRQTQVPVITASRIKPSAILPDTAALVALSESSPCAADRFGSTQDTAYSLGTGASGPQALVLLNCGAGAYNFSSGIYIGQRDSIGRWSFTPAKFDYDATSFSFGPEGDMKVLVNADWDASIQTISSYAKGRGIGDCGTSEDYVWDGISFRLVKARAMDQCRGSTNWIPVWRAEVKLTG